MMVLPPYHPSASSFVCHLGENQSFRLGPLLRQLLIRSKGGDSDIHDTHTPDSPRSLSVFDSPTATFAWPPLQLASQMSQDPVLYVEYSSASRPARLDDGYVSSGEQPPRHGTHTPATPSSSISRRETLSPPSGMADHPRKWPSSTSIR